jgi:hypothetical protein
MSAPDDYTLAENLQTVLSNTLKQPHWNTATEAAGMAGVINLATAVKNRKAEE